MREFGNPCPCHGNLTSNSKQAVTVGVLPFRSFLWRFAASEWQKRKGAHVLLPKNTFQFFGFFTELNNVTGFKFGAELHFPAGPIGECFMVRSIRSRNLEIPASKWGKIKWKPLESDFKPEVFLLPARPLTASTVRCVGNMLILQDKLVRAHLKINVAHRAYNRKPNEYGHHNSIPAYPTKLMISPVHI